MIDTLTIPAHIENGSVFLDGPLPNNVECVEGRGSLAVYTRATELEPALTLAQFKKGHVSSFLGDTDGAGRAYQTAIATAASELKVTLAMVGARRHLYVGETVKTLDELIRLADAVETMGTPPSMVEEMQGQILTDHATAALQGGQLAQAEESIARRSALQRAVGERLGDPDSKRLRLFDCQIWAAERSARRARAVTRETNEIDTGGQSPEGASAKARQTSATRAKASASGGNSPLETEEPLRPCHSSRSSG